MNAKDFVNTIYKPIISLKPGVDEKQWWDYAKKIAIEFCDVMIKELEMLRKPEYTSFIVSYEDHKVATGYERIAYYEELKAEIEKL